MRRLIENERESCDLDVAAASQECRYASLANASLTLTESGRLAISGQSNVATHGQNPMSADIVQYNMLTSRNNVVGRQ